MIPNVKKTLVKFGLSAALCVIPANAFASEINELPTAWRMQQYIGGNAAVYFTGAATCPYGGLNLQGASAAEIDRLWSLVLSAKLANRKVGIIYTGCTIDSFYIQAP